VGEGKIVGIGPKKTINKKEAIAPGSRGHAKGGASSRSKTKRKERQAAEERIKHGSSPFGWRKKASSAGERSQFPESKIKRCE